MPLSGSYYYPSVNTSNPAPQVDDAGYLVNMAYSHHKIHESNLNFVPGFTGSIAQNQFCSWMLRTPSSASGYVHLNYFLGVDNPAKVEVFESASITANRSGSQLFPLNANRNVSGDTACLWFMSSSNPLTGTLMETRFFGTNGAGHQLGGAGSAEIEVDEWILRPDTNYVFRITATSATAVNASVMFKYYLQ